MSARPILRVHHGGRTAPRREPAPPCIARLVDLGWVGGEIGAGWSESLLSESTGPTVVDFLETLHAALAGHPQAREDVQHRARQLFSSPSPGAAR